MQEKIASVPVTEYSSGKLGNWMAPEELDDKVKVQGDQLNMAVFIWYQKHAAMSNWFEIVNEKIKCMQDFWDKILRPSHLVRLPIESHALEFQSPLTTSRVHCTGTLPLRCMAER